MATFRSCGHATIFDMLDDRFTDDGIRKIYETYKPFPSCIQVSLGVDVDLRGEPGAVVLLLDQDIQVDPETTENAVTFRVFNFDPTFAPAGKTAVICILATYNHGYWCGLREKDEVRYEAEKKRVAAAVTAVFERRFPAARGKVGVVDVATPATIVCYTGNTMCDEFRAGASWRARRTHEANGTPPCRNPCAHPRRSTVGRSGSVRACTHCD